MRALFLRVQGVTATGAAMLLPGLAVMPGVALSEIMITPDVHLSADYDSNKRLQLDNRDAVNGYVAEAAVTLKDKDPQWTRELYTQLKSRHYSGDYDLGSDDQSFRGALGYNTERTTTTLNLSGVNDTTLTDQLGISGYTEVLKRRRYGSAGLSVRGQLSEVDTLSAEYSASKAEYIDADETSLVDYRYDSLATSFQHYLDESMAWFASASGSTYEPRDSIYSSESLDVSIGSVWKPTKPWFTKLSIGQRKTEYEYFDGLFSLDDRFNYVTLEATRQLQAGSVSFKTQDLSQPTGDGNLYHIRKALLDYSAEFDLRHRFTVSATCSQQRASSEQYAINDRNNIQLTASYRYRVTQATGIQTVLNYRQQDFLGIHDEAYANSIWLGVYWAPIAYRW